MNGGSPTMNLGADTSDTRNEVVLEFGHAHTSPDYGRAVELAQSISTHSQKGLGRQLRHFVTLTEAEAEKWIALYSIVQNWKSSVVRNGELNNSARGNEWTFRCYLERCKAVDKEGYCFKDNWIGCQRVSVGHSLLLDDGVGSFVGKDKFKPDKDAIKPRVASAINRYGLCPAFSLARSNEQIDKLPEVIDLKTNREWELRVERDYVTGVTRLIGITRTMVSNVAEPPAIRDEELDELGITLPKIRDHDRAWEHKIVVVSHRQWAESARSGSVPQLAELSQHGWQLVTVVYVEGEWHCILQRLTGHFVEPNGSGE